MNAGGGAGLGFEARRVGRINNGWVGSGSGRSEGRARQSLRRVGCPDCAEHDDVHDMGVAGPGLWMNKIQ